MSDNACGRLGGAAAAAGRWVCARWLLGVIIGGFLLALWWAEALPRPLATYKTQGDIILSPPKVYTRERLVNDRFEQAAWLRRQLTQMEGDDGRGFQGHSYRKRREEIDAALAVIQQRKPGDGGTPAQSAVAASGAGTEAPLTGLAVDQFYDANTHREAIRDELMRTLLDDGHDIAGNTLYRLNFDVTVLPGDNTSAVAMIMAEANETPSKGKIEEDYRLNYENWHKHLQRLLDKANNDRVKAIANRQIDEEDSSQSELSLFKAFLYQSFETRLAEISKLAKITPALDAGAIFDIYSRFDGIWADWRSFKTFLAQVESVTRFNEYRHRPPDKLPAPIEVMEKWLRDQFDRAQNFCLRKKSDIGKEENTILQSGRTRLSQYSLPRPPWLPPPTDPTPDTKAKSQGQAVGDQGAQQFPCLPVNDSRTLRLISAIDLYLRAERWLKQVESGSPAVLPPDLNTLEFFSGKNGLPELREAFPKILSAPSNMTYCSSQREPPTPVREFICNAGYWRYLDSSQIKQVIVEFMIHRYQNPEVEFNKPVRKLTSFFDLKMRNCDFFDCQLVLEPKMGVQPTGSDFSLTPITFHELLTKGTVAFSYGVSPRGIVERISSIVERQQAVRLALRGSMSLAGLEMDKLASFLKESEDRLHAIRRNPLVVGFGDHEPVSLSDDDGQDRKMDARKNRVVRFGWMLGPRFNPDGGTPLHIPAQHNLAAVISVPGWWRTLDLRIYACWIDRTDLRRFKNQSAENLRQMAATACKTQDTKPVVMEVRLPGAIDEISSKLKFEVIEQPYVRQQGELRRQALEEGRPGNLVFEGGRLWRSTVVTLGTQIADQIIVLPHMRGIIAKFNCVERPPRMPYPTLQKWGEPPPRPGAQTSDSAQGSPEMDGVQSSDAMAVVWTSEGRTEEAMITILPFQERVQGNRALDEIPCYVDPDYVTDRAPKYRKKPLKPVPPQQAAPVPPG